MRVPLVIACFVTFGSMRDFAAEVLSVVVDLGIVRAEDVTSSNNRSSSTIFEFAQNHV